MNRIAAAAVLAVTGIVLLAPAAGAAPVLTGKQRVTAVSAVTVAPEKTVKAYCPPGKVVIGGGGFVDGPSWIKLSLIRPVQDGHYLEVSARNPWGRPTWGLHAEAICADPPPKLTYVSALSVPQPAQARSAQAACPAGTRVIGLGGRAALEPGRNVTLAQLTPAKDGTAASAGSVAAQGGELNPWTTVSYAVCAEVATTVVSSVSALDSTDAKTQIAVCGPGTLAAVGAMLRGDSLAGTGQVSFGAVFPDVGLSSSVVFAYEDHDLYLGKWRVISYAICG